MSLGVWAVIGLLILLCALYVAAEFGAVGVRRSRLRHMAEEGHKGAKRLLPFVENPQALDQYVAVSQVGITLSSLVLGAVAQASVAVALAPLTARLFGLDVAHAAYWSAIAVLVVLTAVQVVLSELVPKSLALQFPTEVALATVLPMRWSLAAFWPLIVVLNGSANGLLRLLGLRSTGHRHIHSPDELELLIAESRDGGLLEPEEQRRLHRALRLGLRTARDLMVPRERLTMLQLDTPWDEVVRLVASSPFSRLPVYRASPEDVIGTLRVKDLVRHYVMEGAAPPLERLLRPLIRVSHDLPADQVITQLRERRTHQALVVDAEGRLVGLVTIQDALAALLESSGGVSTGIERRA